MNYTGSDNFVVEETIKFPLGTAVAAARMRTTDTGHVLLEMICTGRDLQSVRNDVAGAPQRICKRIFGVQLEAEDILDAKEADGLYIVTLG